MKLLTVDIEDEYIKDIHELISSSMKEKSIPLMFSSISITSRVKVAERYCNKLMSMIDLMYLETSFPHSFWDMRQSPPFTS